jgi:hypothetical protein
LILGQESYAVRVDDLSLKGALLARPPTASLSTGTSCRLELGLGAGQTIVLQGSIAHLEARRLGIVCRVIDIDSVTHLRRLVELNLGTSDLLERELSALLDEAAAGAAYGDDDRPRS